jgi:hypothetical protein
LVRVSRRPPETRTAEFVRKSAEDACSRGRVRNLAVTIDGRKVPCPVRFQVSAAASPLFAAQLPTDNLFGLTPDVAEKRMHSPSAHQGFYLYVRPLEPGMHKIHWTAERDCSFGAVTYELTVLPGVPGLP